MNLFPILLQLMNPKLHHGIIYAENDPLTRKSCVIFNNRHILAPASILMNLFENIRNDLQYTVNHDIQRDLKNNRMIDTVVNPIYSSLANYNFKVVQEKNDVLFESDAYIINLFKCRNIWNSFNDILRNFVPRRETNERNDLHKLLLSSFVLFRIRNSENTRLQEESSASMVFTDFAESLTSSYHSHSNLVNSKSIQKLENIKSISTPFGNECFLNTVNVGCIANIFGDNKCLLVASMPLVNGCEGGGVYINENLIGIVVSCTFHWNSEKSHSILTLVAKFAEVLAEFVDQTNSYQLSNFNLKQDYNSYKNTSIDYIINEVNGRKKNCKALAGGKQSILFENFLVLIQSANSWGSGCFVKINGLHMIITCAHILENHIGSIHCTWKFGHFETKLIYKNPHFDEAFDIALLEAPPNIPEQFFTKCKTTSTNIGQTVYSSGFPHFTSLGKVNDFFPSIFVGKITKISKGVIFSDTSVQSGQSGGPMFADDGHLIGVTVSNSKDDAYQLIYPNINMSVPVYDILPTLEKYGKTRGNIYTLKKRKSVINVFFFHFTLSR